jgi:HD-GYP domain-containing protein (c-di-GMP phosphodiesterase class II)
MAEQIACSHHERWDTTGYPHGLGGEEISEAARVVAVVDVFDALTHDRVYRPAMSEHEALAILETGRGTHFDPRCVSKFMEILPLIRQISHENCDNSEDDRGATNYRDYMPYNLHGPAPAVIPPTLAGLARPSAVPTYHLSSLAGSAL